LYFSLFRIGRVLRFFMDNRAFRGEDKGYVKTVLTRYPIYFTSLSQLNSSSSLGAILVKMAPTTKGQKRPLKATQQKQST
jgi:hypothetical protein